MRMQDQKLLVASVLHIVAEMMLAESPLKTLAQQGAQDSIVKFYNRNPNEEERAIFLKTSRIMKALIEKCIKAENMGMLEHAVAYAEDLLNGSVVIEDEQGHRNTA